MNIIKRYIQLILLIFVVGVNFSQDIHFSQFTFTPTFLNPATAGTYKGDYRATLNFKEQYSSFNKAYQTYRASYDMPIVKSEGYKKTGAGLDFFQDIAGDSKTKLTSLMFHLSQTVQFSSFSDFSMGVSFGFSQYSANYTNLTWDTQFNGLDYNEELPSQEIFFGRSQGYFDFSAGLLYRHFDYYGFPYEFGISVSHLSTPSLSLIGGIDELPMKIVFQGKKEFELTNDRIGIVPMFFVSNQRKSFEYNGGLMVRYDLGIHSKYTGYYKNSTVYFGATYRFLDAIIPQFYINFKEKYTLGLSYDINISPLVSASQYKGGLEVSLSLSGFFSKKYNVISPVTF